MNGEFQRLIPNRRRVIVFMKKNNEEESPIDGSRKVCVIQNRLNINEVI
jgi:hypothetical protein